MTMEAEIRVMQVQAKECQGLPGAMKEAMKRQEGVSPRVCRESVALLTASFWTPNLQNYDSVHFCCFKSPVL